MIVRVEQLVKRYQELVALDHFSLQVEEGEILGLLGPNGSGKTTAINCMLSLLKYDKGSVELFGEPMRPDAYEIKKQIGAYAAAMGGLDAVVFTGGIGENAIGIRKLACSGLEFLGIKLDEERNIALNHGEGRISTDDSKVEVWIVPTNEELLIAMDTQALVENQAL